MADEGSMGERRSGDKLHQLGCGIALAAVMDHLVEPALERIEFAAGEHRSEAAQVAVGLFEELRSVEVAERIRREVANQGGRPVNVLQAALSVGRRLDAQILPVLLAPCGGQVADRQLLREQGLLQLKADNDVQVVRRFVGLDANQRWCDMIDGEEKVVELDIPGGGGKYALKLWKKVPPKSAAAGDQVFPHP